MTSRKRSVVFFGLGGFFCLLVCFNGEVFLLTCRVYRSIFPFAHLPVVFLLFSQGWGFNSASDVLHLSFTHLFFLIKHMCLFHAEF